MKILTILGTIQGLLFAGFLFTVKKNRAANLQLIAAIVFSVIQIGLFVASYELSPSPLKFDLKLISLFFIFPIPAFYYFYIRFLVSEAKYEWKDLIHGLPTLLAFLSVLPLFLLPEVEKNSILASNNPGFIQKEILHMATIVLLIIGYGY